MATITITRGFNDNDSEVGVTLVSAHVPLSMTFDFDRGAISGSYATVIINNIVFLPTKTATVANVDSYIITGDMLVYLLSIPTQELSSLLHAPTIVVKGYNSSNTEIATATHNSFKICHAISVDKLVGLENLEYSGRSKTVYYNNAFTYFAPALNAFTTKSSTATGAFSENGAVFNIVQVPSETIRVEWLNRDGCYDNCSFKLIGTELLSTKNDRISLFNEQLKTWTAYDQQIGNETTEKMTLKTIALNTDHYEQLLGIGTAFVIYIGAEIWEVDDVPKKLSACRQNLNFTFTLKRKTHAVSY